MLLTQKDGLIMGPLSRLIGWILNNIYNLLSNVGIESIAISIIILTFVVRLCIYPLSVKSTKSSKIQNYLRPEFNKIYKKYKGKKDQASMMKQQQEISELQKKYGIKMTSGCLTSIIQIPIMFSLYYVIQNIPAYVSKVKELFMPIAQAIYGHGNEGLHFAELSKFVSDNKLTVGNLSEASYSINSVIDVLYKCSSEKMTELLNMLNVGSSQLIQNIDKIHDVNNFILGINMSEAPGWKLSWALIIPIASMLFNYLSMAIMPIQSTGDPQQDQSMNMMRSMTKIMPVFSFIICVTVPAGVGLYWAVGAFISFLTTFLTNYYFDHCDMEKIVEKEKEKAAKKIEKDKKKGKKSFMERLNEAAYGAQNSDSETSGMDKITGTKLKNYTSSTSVNSSDNVKYKPGSIAAKANALKQYNEKGGKE